ncbi:uncharacterized protein LY89DRAFT_688005 [Mollisia scopiformis]|uniref:Glucose-methanol-choline oxidoreductase C-terminal domain-containing protein n=1 Tax=Mollisia scopiformis TaxID=149040 RepID=A0A194WWA8_MOLSC|nr:uncharacterized protein LY89DRAFT_688005 [Mollisia scopiformis]KUJ12250.1 hypothetical protein LY89DRAFT_688005 [Mollisia scopiformis]
MRCMHVSRLYCTHITSSDISEPPRIESNYLPHPLDIGLCARHILFLQTLAKTEPLVSYLKPDGKRNHPTAFLKDLEDAKANTRATSVPVCHYSGTCAMLPREKGGVVNVRLVVYRTKKWRVVDASIMPLIQEGNCQNFCLCCGRTGSRSHEDRPRVGGLYCVEVDLMRGISVQCHANKDDITYRKD